MKNTEHEEKLHRAIAMATAKYPEESIMLLDEGALRERAGTIRKHFMGTTAYAVKANPRRRILKILVEEGITTFDCSSPEEVSAVQKVNPDAKILYNMPVNTRSDIAAVLARGGRHFTAHDREGVEEILTCALLANKPPQQIPLEEIHIVARLETFNPHAAIDLSDKFGATTEETEMMIEDIRRAGASPGLSIHTGSQNTDPNEFKKGIRKMTKLARDVGGVDSINVGGGLPANIHDGDRYLIEGYLDEINSAIRKNLAGVFRKDAIDRVYIEPGRAMVAEAVDLIIPVLSVTTRRGERVIYMKEGLFGSFFDAALHKWQFPFEALRRNDRRFSDQKATFKLLGQTCDSGDKIGTKVLLPENIQRGDYLHVPSAGAYMSSQASDFNGCKKARYVSYKK